MTRRSARQRAARPTLVQAGELRVARAGESLMALGVGSCVIVALFDRESAVGGMAHPLLPRPVGRQDVDDPGRFALTAVPRLVELLEEQGADRRALRCWLAGGASILPALRDAQGPQVGRRNLAATRLALRYAGIRVRAEAVGGDASRSVYLHTDDGSVVVSSQNGPDITL